MSAERKSQPRRHYEVGRGKPPVATRFQKGQSGNPTGRPRKKPRSDTLDDLALREGYRMVTIREGGKPTRIPALAAVIRSQLALAMKGNGPAQRAFLRNVKRVEDERSVLFREYQEAMITYKAEAEKEIARRKALGIKDISDIDPHPATILVDSQTGEIWTREMWPKDAAIIRALNLKRAA